MVAPKDGQEGPGEVASGAADKDGGERNARRANPIDTHVGSRVRLRRMLLGMSQEKLAEQLGLTFQQVQKYERGINRIGASRLFDLSRLLGVSVQYFYDDAPELAIGVSAPSGFAERPSDNYVFDFLNSREGLELNRAFLRIPDPKVRRSLIDLMKSMAVEGEEAEETAPAVEP
jgi:transcriptional regulator with XRE-family HTH domain